VKEKGKKMGQCVCALALAFVFTVSASSAVFAAERGGYEQRVAQETSAGEKKGWWWYEVKPEPKDEEELEEKKPPVEGAILKQYTYDQLIAMHPDQLKELFDQALKSAVQKPSDANMLDYYTMIDVSRRKSLAFANATAAFVQKNPDYSTLTADPIAAPGKVATTRQQVDEAENYVRQAKGNYALLYFTSEGCPYCEEQDSILKYFISKYEWEVKKIDRESNSALAAKLGVTMVPALVLIGQGQEDWMPVSAGVTSLGDIERALYRGVRLLSGDMGSEQYGVYDFEKGGPLDPAAQPRRGKK